MVNKLKAIEGKNIQRNNIRRWNNKIFNAN